MLSQIFREGISHMLPTWISSGHHFPSVTTHEPEKTTAKIFLDLANALRLKPTVLSGFLPTFMFLGQMIILLIVVLYFFIFLHFINYFSWKRQLKNQVNCVTRHGIPFIFFTIFHSYSFFPHSIFSLLFFHLGPGQVLEYKLLCVFSSKPVLVCELFVIKIQTGIESVYEQLNLYLILSQTVNYPPPQKKSIYIMSVDLLFMGQRWVG